jgi:hypothetical protein
MVPLKVIVGSELAAGILLTHQLENVFVWQVFIVIFTLILTALLTQYCYGESFAK